MMKFVNLSFSLKKNEAAWIYGLDRATNDGDLTYHWTSQLLVRAKCKKSAEEFYPVLSCFYIIWADPTLTLINENPLVNDHGYLI